MSSEPGSHNEINGDVAGSSVQAGRIDGDVHINLHPSAPKPVVPSQLPAGTRAFVGRAGELAALTAALENSCTDPVIQVISGIAGAGKTELALHWAKRITHRFPDGQLYVNLRGFDPGGTPMWPAEAVRGFLDALEISSDRIPLTLDAQAAKYRSELAGKRMLILLDNARDAEQVRPLLPGSAAADCAVVVTSRDRLDSLTDGTARLVPLGAMTPSEAKDLLIERLGAERVESEPKAVSELIDRCAHLPLALTLVAAHQTQWECPLDALVAELREEQDRLYFLDDNRADGIRAVFSWSYRALTPQAASMFRLLGLHSGPVVSLPAAAALAGVPVKHARASLAELTREHLLEERGFRRYAFHDLLRSYAAERVAEDEPESRRRAAVRRVLDHYLHSALAADRYLAPHRSRITVAAPPDDVSLAPVTSDERALGWFITEHATLLAAVETAVRHGLDVHAWQLPWSLATYFERKGHWHDWIGTQTTAVSAATHLGDRPAQARTHLIAARAAARLDRLNIADAHLEQALALYTERGNRLGLARSHITVSWVRELQRRFPDAVWHAAASLELFRAVGNRSGEARALDQLGWEQALSGDCRSGLMNCERALELFIELEHRSGQADCEDSLGYINHRLGNYVRAIKHLQRSVALSQELGDAHTEAVSRDRLGDTYLALGEQAEARKTWQLALATLEDLAAPEEARVRDKLRRLAPR